MTSRAIEITNLVHAYAEPGSAPKTVRTVLNIPQWQAATGEQILLRGKSGSGKTTFLNLIAGLLTPTHGQISIAGQALNQLSEARRDQFRGQHIGYVFQTHNLLPLTAFQNIEMPLAFLGKPARLRRQLTLDMLTSVGLAEWARHRPHQLSAGQRMRVAIARALVVAPSVLLADEPTAALDADTGEGIMDLLQLSCEQHGATLIVASHDPAIVTRFARRIDLRDAILIEESATHLPTPEIHETQHG